MSAEWLYWYYLIYWLPAAVAMLILLMSSVGGHHGGHSHAAHGGLRLHTHTGGGGHATAQGHAAPAGHGVHGAHPPATGHASAHSGTASGHPRALGRSAPGIGHQLLGFFGVGRAPVTVLLGSLLLGWGFFGLAATDWLEHGLHLPLALFFLPALAAAAAGGLFFAKLFGELAARVMPQDETCAISREGLLGLTGKVVYPVSESGGRVHVFDSFRTLHVEPARVSPGQPAIEKGTEVIVASMDPDQGYLIVEPLGFSRTAVSRQPSAVRNGVQAEAGKHEGSDRAKETKVGISESSGSD